MRKYFSDWNIFEKIWLLLSITTMLCLSIISEENPIALISAITGITGVVLCAKGKISMYIFSVINVSTYAWICYGNKLYGEAMVNAFYFLPMNITGFILWRKHRSGTEVKTRNLSVRGLVILAVITVITVAAYWQALKFLQGSLPLIDSMTTIIAIIALFLQVMRYSEQWLLWITVNAISILLWIIMMIQGDNSGKTMVVMWSAYFVNSIYGYINWKKLANTQA